MTVGVPDTALRETCRLVRGAVPLWPYHHARLGAGGCGADLLATVDAVVHDAAMGWAGPHSSRLRLTVVVDAGGGVDVRIQRRLSSLDVPGGPVAAVVEIDEPASLPPGAAKPADRAWWDRAQRAARAAGGDQAILAHAGRVIDGGTSTVWISAGAGLATPPAPSAIAGVARAFLLERFAESGVPVEVRDIGLEEFLSAREAFLTNAFAGAVAIRGRSGPHAASAAALFASVWGPAAVSG
jgi:branched-subunit amino acid aminotransferase/4-amino-4-deoxychorismate lyase